MPLGKTSWTLPRDRNTPRAGLKRLLTPQHDNELKRLPCPEIEEIALEGALAAASHRGPRIGTHQSKSPDLERAAGLNSDRSSALPLRIEPPVVLEDDPPKKFALRCLGLPRSFFRAFTAADHQMTKRGQRER